MVKQLKVDVSEYGFDRPVIMRGPSNKAWRVYSKGVKDPESDEAQLATLTMLQSCIVEAPFPLTVEAMDELDMRLIVELGLAIRELMDPLSARVRRLTSTDSSKPTSQAGPTIQS